MDFKKYEIFKRKSYKNQKNKSLDRDSIIRLFYFSYAPTLMGIFKLI